jgi:hypothetical protein
MDNIINNNIRVAINDSVKIVSGTYQGQTGVVKGKTRIFYNVQVEGGGGAVRVGKRNVSLNVATPAVAAPSPPRHADEMQSLAELIREVWKSL